jgi:hypothetical protein
MNKTIMPAIDFKQIFNKPRIFQDSTHVVHLDNKTLAPLQAGVSQLMTAIENTKRITPP